MLLSCQIITIIASDLAANLVGNLLIVLGKNSLLILVSLIHYVAKDLIFVLNKTFI